MKPNEAIVLAGGFGTRLKSVVADIPKPMAPIDETPFLEYLLLHLKKFGIEHVVLSVGYKWEYIQEYFGDNYAGIELSYAVEKEALGTGGGIKLAMQQVRGDHVFILNGDTYFDVNLNDLSEFYFAHKADMAITVKRKRDFFRYGTVLLDICKVVGFKEKQPMKSGLINGGVYICRRNIFDSFTLPERFSFETDLLEGKLDELKVCAMRSTDYFIDIGLPADYTKAQLELPQRYRAQHSSST